MSFPQGLLPLVQVDASAGGGACSFVGWDEPGRKRSDYLELSVLPEGVGNKAQSSPPQNDRSLGKG